MVRIKIGKAFKLSLLFLFLSLSLPASALELNLEVEPAVVKPGQTFIVLAESTDRLKEITGKFLDKEVKLYPWGFKYRGIFGVDLKAPEGTHSLLVKAVDKEGGYKTAETAVRVAKGIFKSVRFTLPPAKTKLLAPEVIAADWEKIGAVITRESEEQVWYRKFKRPAAGRITMPFGTYEIVNRKPAGRHKGVDMAGRVGSPVKASNHGVVALAEPLQAHGNTVILDHGQGIFTMYLHLSEIKVKEGERVSRGQVIGGLGASGVSSGPHLHFGLSVHDVRVDPMEWVRREVAE